MEHPESRGNWACYVGAIVKKEAEEYLLLFTYPRKLKPDVEKTFVRCLRSFRFAGDATPDADEEAAVEERGEVLGDPAALADLEKRDRIKKDLVGTWQLHRHPALHRDLQLRPSARRLHRRAHRVHAGERLRGGLPAGRADPAVQGRPRVQGDGRVPPLRRPGRLGRLLEQRDGRARVPRPLPEQEARRGDGGRHAPRGLPPVHPLRAAGERTRRSGSTRASRSTSSAWTPRGRSSPSRSATPCATAR